MIYDLSVALSYAIHSRRLVLIQRTVHIDIRSYQLLVLREKGGGEQQESRDHEAGCRNAGLFMVHNTLHLVDL